MQLTSFLVRRKYLLKMFWLLLMVTSSHSLMAESLTYSPDQWPRHWNVLMNKANHQQDRNSNKYRSQAPLRSKVWGVVPRAKQKSRRSLRPEYDTNSHMHNYYSGYRGFAAPITYGMPLLLFRYCIRLEETPCKCTRKQTSTSPSWRIARSPFWATAARVARTRST